MSLNVAASLADIVDGPIARSTPDRHPAFAVVGSKLDCYSDIVSHFVVPASLLMHISDVNALCTALAALYVCAGILRHVSSSDSYTFAFPSNCLPRNKDGFHYPS